MIETRSDGKTHSPTDYNFLRLDAQNGNRMTVVPKSTSDFALIQRDRRSNFDDKVSMASHDERLRSPGHKKKSAWRSFSRLTQNSRSRSVSRLFSRTERMTETVGSYSIDSQKLRPSKSLFNFRLFGTVNGDSPGRIRSTLKTVPHSQSQVLSSSTTSRADDVVIPPKRFRPRPRSEIICEPDSVNALYNRRRSLTPVISLIFYAWSFVRLLAWYLGLYAIG